MSGRERLPQDERLDRRRWVPLDDVDTRVRTGRAELARRMGAEPRGARVGPAVLWGGVIAAAAAVALVWWVSSPDAPGPTVAQDEMQTGAEATRFALPDGSTITAEAHSSVDLVEKRPDLVRVALRQGAAVFDVTRDEGRRFVVEAGAVEVRVLGTRFRVTRRGAEVGVDVERGLVEVAVAGDVRRLAAGERWSRTSPAPRQEAAAIPRAVHPDEAIEEPRADESRVRSARRRPRSSRAAEPVEPSAAQLFDDAIGARRAGRLREAAQGFERFLRQHGDDARAPLAALELGRLRMDSLGDRAGAASALERALRTSPSAPFRQDALARLVRLYDGMGRTPDCARARSRYLREFPDGPHAGDVAERCTP